MGPDQLSVFLRELVLVFDDARQQPGHPFSRDSNERHFWVKLLLAMFDEHYKDGSFAGEKSRKRRLIGVRVGIFLAITVIGLLVAGYMKWSKSSLHERLMIRRGEANAYYDRKFYMNGTSTNPTYSIGYSYRVNGKRYHDYTTSKTTPTSPEGVVFYDPDDPEQNELQPFE